MSRHTCQSPITVSSCSTCLFVIDAHHAPHIRCLPPTGCTYATWSARPYCICAPLFSSCPFPPCISILRFPNLHTPSWILDVLLNSPSQSTLLPCSLDCFSLVTCHSSFRVSIGHLWSVNGELYFNISPPIEYGRFDKSNVDGIFSFAVGEGDCLSESTLLNN